MDNISDALRSRRLILDGAMGTLLPRTEFGHADVLCISSPKAVAQAHHDYLIAGANIITTNSLCSNSIYFPNGFNDCSASEMAYRAARIATNGGHRNYWVAGSVGPIPSSSEAFTAYKDQAQGLIKGGVDFLLLETTIHASMAVAALQAFKQAMASCCHDIPVAISFTPMSNGLTADGLNFIQAVDLVQKEMPLLAVGANCASLSRIQEFIKDYNAGMPLIVYPSTNQELEELSPQDFAHKLVDTFIHKAAIFGTCCGSTPAHTKELSIALNS